MCILYKKATKEFVHFDTKTKRSDLLTTPRGKPAGVPMIAFYQHPYTARALG